MAGMIVNGAWQELNSFKIDGVDTAAGMIVNGAWQEQNSFKIEGVDPRGRNNSQWGLAGA